MARRRVSPIGLSFLDAITCGFGAVVLFFMIINASSGLRAGRMTSDLRGAVDLLEEEVLAGYDDLVEVRNSVQEVDDQTVTAQGLSRRFLKRLEELRAELATFDASTLARNEHINRLQADLKSLEEDARRLSGGPPSEEAPGAKTRSFVGDGDRQYLTGLKVGGKRVFILVDVSASMLDDTIVNVIRWRNLPERKRIRAEKWQQAVSTVDWLTTQLPRDSRFQLYTFHESAQAVVPGSGGRWLDVSDPEMLDEAVARLRQVVPNGGTNLYRAFEAVSLMNPKPDNVILLVDSLPTQGRTPPRRNTVSGEQRAKLFNRAVQQLPGGIPVNVILFPMEGDPIAASAYWKLALATRGSFLSPSEDWP